MLRVLFQALETMPRKLPWKTEGTNAPSNLTPSPTQRPRVDHPAKANATKLGLSKLGRERALTQSTSPPPAPPEEVYMEEGYSADDKWIMVEDEFTETAHMFTQHLHYAEYKRLMNLAKERKEFISRSISRPTVPGATMSGAAKVRQHAEELSERQERTVGPLLARQRKESTNEKERAADVDKLWEGDARLAGLMTRPKQSKGLLSSLANTKSNTRAAAGYSVAPSLPPQRSEAAPPESMGIGRVSTTQTKRTGCPTQDIKEHEHVQESRDGTSRFLPAGRMKETGPRCSAVSPSNPTTNGEPSRQNSLATYRRGQTSKKVDKHYYPSRSKPRTPEKLSWDPMSPHPSPLESDTVSLDDVRKKHGVSGSLTERLAKRKAGASKKDNGKDDRQSILLDEIPTFLV
ncbi:hypothetical protein BDY21DRAFT_133321 [Lineolata rhizophorae]|uniref:Uncharacterized protein n=1 Tax=Lineolata rhizophorae TaxID=578093 RepID=A0A6A6PAB6_9PEZI|nr:hypothetical protein BDY21DRAFT_133321 [Lineolata rhizophorae]